MKIPLLGKLRHRGKRQSRVNNDPGEDPLEYIDPDGRWFLLDDMIFSLLAYLNGDLETSWWQGTLDSFLYSWKNPIEHGKDFVKYVNIFKQWLDDSYGIDGFISWHHSIDDESEIGIKIDVDERNATFWFRKKPKKTKEIEIDWSDITGENNEK